MIPEDKTLIFQNTKSKNVIVNCEFPETDTVQIYENMKLKSS